MQQGDMVGTASGIALKNPKDLDNERRYKFDAAMYVATLLL
jgi:hypothetical protein